MADEDIETYDVEQIQARWLPVWDDLQPFRSGVEGDPRPTKYVLDMFPYPSGDLHMGHAEAYALGDIIARYDDFSGSLNSRAYFVPAADGLYHLEAKSAFKYDIGAYQLRVALAPADDHANALTASATALVLGEAKAGEIADDRDFLDIVRKYQLKEQKDRLLSIVYQEKDGRQASAAAVVPGDRYLGRGRPARRRPGPA